MSKFTAFTKSETTDDFVFTYPQGDKWMTVVSDINPAGPPTIVSPSKTEEQARTNHAEKVALMQAGKIGEFDSNEKPA